MTKKIGVQMVLMATALAGCASSSEPEAQRIQIDDHHTLRVAVRGIDSQQVQGGMSAPQMKEGVPVHRVLTSGDGKVLFAYDLAVKKNAASGTWQIILNPSKKDPTFAAVREVEVLPQQEVRVELMEQQGTNRKVMDVFTLSEGESPSPHSIIVAHLLAAHEQFRKWVHGEANQLH